MIIDKSDIMDDIEDIQIQVDAMGFMGTNEQDLWRRDLIADYIVKKLNLAFVVF
tara:strand:+ start:40 stop:201 length:162 start_codon:yes stop_codon:yes gene_type:complete